MGKRGRKPSKDSVTLYFGETEERAVKDYLNTDDIIYKNQLYNTILRPAFKKMVESLIRSRDLYVPDEDSGETFNDALSFLFSKVEKFEPDRGTKAYSYFGNVCKNYLIARKKKFDKERIKYDNYDNFDTLSENFGNDIRYSSDIDRNSKIAKETVEGLIERIKEMVEKPDENCLKESEIILGNALVKLLDEWDDVLTTKGSDKLIKSVILNFLKDETKLTAKGIRDNMKKYKKEFLIIKNSLIE